MAEKVRSPRNQTITLTGGECTFLKQKLTSPESVVIDTTVLGDYRATIPYLKDQVDLLILDPPYNLTKKFGTETFTKRSTCDYSEYLSKVLDNLIPLVKTTGSVYICGDWLSSASIYEAAANRLKVRNRITWEREKGRGAKTNWKN